MKRTLQVLAIGGIFLAQSGLGADAIGRVVAIEGKATVARADGSTGALVADSPIFLNDRVSTAEKSKLQIRFTDDSAISQGEKSELVIDQYVFNPDKKEENGYATRMLKGIFRLITGKITELNPERFKVSTKMATIGIRGCELGFRLQDRSEDIYIVDVTEGQRVVVEAEAAVRELAGRVLNIERGGVTVSLLAGAGMTQRPLTAREATQLLQDSTPRSPSDRPMELSKAINNVIQEATARVAETTPTRTAEVMLAEVAGGGSSGPGNFTGPTTPPPTQVTPETPPPATRVAIGGGPFSDWDWGLWDDGSTSYSGNFITVTDWQAIQAAGVPYDLITPTETSGQAGAYLSDGSTRTLVQGTCNLNVQINVGGGSRWGGAFSMSSKDNQSWLQFAVNLGTGIVDPATGSIRLPTFTGTTHTDGYAMRVGGKDYGPTSIQGEGLIGRPVVHTAGGPITGVSGSFYFTHSGAVRADGVFGSNLQPR